MNPKSLIEKVQDAIKAHEQTEDVIFVQIDLQLARQGPTDAKAVAVVGNLSEKRMYSLSWNPLNDGYDIKHIDICY